MKITIRHKLILINLVIILPLLLVAFYSYFSIVKSTRNESSWKIRLVAEEIAKDLATEFDKTFNVIDAIATHPTVTTMNPAACDPLFARLLPSYPLHLNILAANRAGFNVGSAVTTAGVHQLNYLDKEWFQRASKGERVIGNLHRSKLFKAPAIMIAAPVYASGNRLQGVVGFPLNLESLRSRLIKNWQLPEQSLILIVDGAGNLLVDTLHPGHVGENVTGFPLMQAARKTVGGFLEMPGRDEVKRLYYVTRPSGTDWRVIVGVPSLALSSSALLINGRYLLAILLATALGVSISLVIGHQINDNIVRIITGIKAIGSGNLAHRIELRGNDDLAAIEASFNQMAAEHYQYEQDIKGMNALLEQRVAERTAQLVAANDELDSFSYSVSHDLRAPLRTITGFSDMLREKYQAQLDADGKHWLDRIVKGCVKMDSLINALLELSHINRAQLHIQPVNLSDMALQIAEELRQAQPERRVDFRIAPGVTAAADPVLIRTVMENLLGNAWKFTQYTAAPVISFAAEERDGSSVYVVRDNGAGFNQAYADQLFTAFQRLHPHSEFEGTGIGLASVQRVIHRHGGTIWAESEENEGAAFYFTC